MLDVRRRQFMALLGGAAAAWPLAAYAQQRMWRIGVLTLASSKDDGRVLAAFVDGLHSHGYVEGKNLDIYYRYSDGDVKRLAALARELIVLKPDVLLGAEPSPVRARVAFLSNPTGASMQFFAHSIEETARQRGVVLLTEEAATPDALAPAFDRMVRQQAQAIIVPTNGLFRNEVGQIVELAAAARLPTIFAKRDRVEGGGLASYGVDQRENYRRAADYVDKMLKGAKPGEMPIEFPTKVEMVPT
jgi:ABC-type uncharacterized transport system substrate-binding protein